MSLPRAHRPSDELGFQVYTFDTKDLAQKALDSNPSRGGNGSLDVEVKVYFAPQRFLQIGTVIFFATLLACLQVLYSEYRRNVNVVRISS